MDDGAEPGITPQYQQTLQAAAFNDQYRPALKLYRPPAPRRANRSPSTPSAAAQSFPVGTGQCDGALLAIGAGSEMA
jgi:hypothetical protein